jgi:hypothetical protein
MIAARRRGITWRATRKSRRGRRARRISGIWAWIRYAPGSVPASTAQVPDVCIELGTPSASAREDPAPGYTQWPRVLQGAAAAGWELGVRVRRSDVPSSGTRGHLVRHRDADTMAS